MPFDPTFGAIVFNIIVGSVLLSIGSKQVVGIGVKRYYQRFLYLLFSLIVAATTLFLTSAFVERSFISAAIGMAFGGGTSWLLLRALRRVASSRITKMEGNRGAGYSF